MRCSWEFCLQTRLYNDIDEYFQGIRVRLQGLLEILNMFDLSRVLCSLSVLHLGVKQRQKVLQNSGSERE